MKFLHTWHFHTCAGELCFSPFADVHIKSNAYVLTGDKKDSTHLPYNIKHLRW